MIKLGDNIESGYFLRMSYWVGLSNRPGFTGMFVYPDGKYIVQQVYRDIKNGTATELENKSEGILNEDELQKVKAYIDANVKEDFSKMIFDAGHSVEVYRDGKTIRIENDGVVFGAIADIVGFRQKSAAIV